MVAAFVTLRAVSPLGWISLLIPIIASLAGKFIYTKEKVEENVNALRVYRAEQQSNIDAISNAITMLELMTCDSGREAEDYGEAG